MKYTSKALPLAALSMAALLFSSDNAVAGTNGNTSVGHVSCFVNQDETVVRLRRFVNYLQVSQEDIPVIDDGFGIEKRLYLIANYCRSEAIELCNHQQGAATFTPIRSSGVAGNLVTGGFRWNCQ